ncbi:MAG: hypothetical protein KAT35_00060, partial [Candidatus Aenigmarchaeota archaeon]|nr:hypothetical protein [Candidatus Aenigmarchaeota archaeon]
IDEPWASTKLDDESHVQSTYTYKNGLIFQRKNLIWPVYFSGGNIEFITEDFQNTDDFSQYEKLWGYTWNARKFMEENLPFWEMQPADSLLTGEASGRYEDGQVFAKPGEVYAVYLPDGNPSGQLDLGAVSGSFQKRWYNPRTGQFEGSATTVSGGSAISLGSPPSASSEDWVVLLEGSGSVTLSVTAFTLIDADSDTDIGPLIDGDRINLAYTPTQNLNIRADTEPPTVGSVRFNLDGNNNYRTENVAPYALEGDYPVGDFFPWTPGIGTHTLAATPYSGTDGGGQQGSPLFITFDVVSEYHSADNIPPLGCISQAELVAFIYMWHQDSTANTMRELMEAVGLWKSSVGC